MPSSSTPNKSKIQPFEWLTSPESIGRFVREHVELQQPKAMHIGCGSSTVGEYLVRELGFSKVANVDRDRETLEGMAERWSEMTNEIGDEKKEDYSTTQKEPLVLTPESTSENTSNNPMEFWCLDYTSQTLPEHYAESFDLVVDKSTLDCTLCSDCSATAAFLSEIYRTLSANHGIYLVISFHELDLILPLVRDLPGAHWKVSHTTMERQVECIHANQEGISTTTTSQPQNAPDNTALTEDCDNDDTEHALSRKPLNVLIAQKLPTIGGNASSSILVLKDVVQHVQQVNDRWFQDEQPLLTQQRIEDLKFAFMNENLEHSKSMTLEQAYEVLFTDAEREHLTYEYFLEDWEAFCQERHQESSSTETIDYDLALSFLRANQ